MSLSKILTGAEGLVLTQNAEPVRFNGVTQFWSMDSEELSANKPPLTVNEQVAHKSRVLSVQCDVRCEPSSLQVPSSYHVHLLGMSELNPLLHITPYDLFSH